MNKGSVITIAALFSIGLATTTYAAQGQTDTGGAPGQASPAAPGSGTAGLGSGANMGQPESNAGTTDQARDQGKRKHPGESSQRVGEDQRSSGSGSSSGTGDSPRGMSDEKAGMSGSGSAGSGSTGGIPGR